MLIAVAYNVDAAKLSGGGAWVRALPLMLALRVAPDLTDRQFRAAMRAVLSVRLGLRGRIVKKPEPVIVLRARKRGPVPRAAAPCRRAKPASRPTPRPERPCGTVAEFWKHAPGNATSSGVREIIARSVTMGEFAQAIGPRHTTVRILDRTDLKGRYDLDVLFHAHADQFSPATGDALSAALRNQTGLLLDLNHTTTRTVPEFVIKQIHQPAPN